MKSIKYNKSVAVILFLTWLGFLTFVSLDNIANSKNSLDVIQTLQQSVFARGMFTDVGILSALIAAWMIFYTKYKVKYIFALITLCIGSLGALPYLAYYFWHKKDEN